MRILLDTNIIIPLEDSSQTLHESFGDFVRLANTHRHTLLVHPSSLDDINRDPDKKRRGISLSRFRKYVPLAPAPAPPSSAELTSHDLTPSNDNDRVDNEILFSIYRDAANILISEDRRLHKKSCSARYIRQGPLPSTSCRISETHSCVHSCLFAQHRRIATLSDRCIYSFF